MWKVAFLEGNPPLPLTAPGPVRDLPLVGTSQGLAHRCIPTCPYVAPHTAKIHTPITLGIRNRAKLLVFQIRYDLPCGFDSHRPLHSKTTSDNPGLLAPPQIDDCLGRSWDSASISRQSPVLDSLRLPWHSHGTSHAGVFKRTARDGCRRWESCARGCDRVEALTSGIGQKRKSASSI
jgi:hypothetical protein